MTTRLFPFNLNPPHLGFPLPGIKVAWVVRPEDANPRKKRRSLLPFLLPVAGIGADYAFNQGKISKNIWNSLSSFFNKPKAITTNTSATAAPEGQSTGDTNTRQPAPKVAPSVTPQSASVPLKNTSSDRTDAFHKALTDLDLLNAQLSDAELANVGVAPAPKHPYASAAMDTARAAGTVGAVTSFLPKSKVPVAGTIGRIAAPINVFTGIVDALNDPNNLELGKLYTAASAAKELAWLNPTTAPIMFAHNMLKPDVAGNLATSQMQQLNNAATADTVNAMYRSAKDQVAKGLNPPEYLNTVANDIARVLKPIDTKNLAHQDLRSKIFDPMLGEGSTGSIKLDNPVLWNIVTKLRNTARNTPQPIPQGIDLLRDYNPNLGAEIRQMANPMPR